MMIHTHQMQGIEQSCVPLLNSRLAATILGTFVGQPTTSNDNNPVLYTSVDHNTQQDDDTHMHPVQGQVQHGSSQLGLHQKQVSAQSCAAWLLSSAAGSKTLQYNRGHHKQQPIAQTLLMLMQTHSGCGMGSTPAHHNTPQTTQL